MVEWDSWAVVLPEWGGSLGLGGAGGVWFGPTWVVREVWGLVWWGLVGEWSVEVSMGVVWLGDSIV